jgi:diacylglycerol O-acyltransferase
MDGGARAGRLDRLTPSDVSNLRVEDRGRPMHVAALAIVEGAPLLDAKGHLRLDALQEHLERRLHLAPRLRQVMVRPGLGLGPPLWVDDPMFDIGEHVRARVIPAPGDEATLLKACADLNEPPLDRSRPLWEMWLLSGLADGTVASLIRLHHAVADGIAALELMGALLDPAPDAPIPVGGPWTARPAPGTGELLVDNLRGKVDALSGALSQARHPLVAIRRVSSRVLQVRQLLREGAAPGVSFNRPVGKHRRLQFVRADLDLARTVAHAHAATVNDVVLTAVAGGARSLLVARQELARGLVLKASVAASIRRPSEDRAGGNRVGIMLVPLPVGEPDPIVRLERIAQATAERKRWPPYQPGGRLLQRWMVRAMPRQRLVNLFTSNLHGPPMPMYLAGARVLELFQVGVVEGNVPLSVGVLSFEGHLNFDIVGDPDVVPDLDVFAEGLTDALEQMGAVFRKEGLAAQGGER